MVKTAQQEIAGFVIIVVLVVVASFIFLVISTNRNTERYTDSSEVQALLDSLLAQTTDCIIQEPFFADVRDLVSIAYAGTQSCRNKNVVLRDYVKEIIEISMENALRTETRFKAYQIDISMRDQNEYITIQTMYQGTCGDAITLGADRVLSVSGGSLRVMLRICLDTDN